MTVQDIVEKYLKENGYDGLCDAEGCQCFNGELFSLCYSDDIVIECIAGYKHKTNEPQLNTEEETIICTQKIKNELDCKDCDYYDSCDLKEEVK